MSKIASIFDLEDKARKRLPAVLFDYIHGGSEQQLTVQRNLDDMRALALRQHSLRNVAARETKVTMAGDPARIPLAIGPTGLAGLTWANGECEAARAALEFGVPYCLSTCSINSIEDVADAIGHKPFWFQLYLMKAQRVNESLIRRACLYGLAAEGREGVLCALTLFEQELHDCMMLAGLSSLSNIPPGVVTAQPPLGRQR
jgi:L-lactate dehydrogenase (cytochrome)